MWGKWAYAVIIVFIVGIGFMFYRANSMGIEDYLELAEVFEEKGSYKDVDFNLKKALKISQKTYGEISAESANIYRKLGAAEQDLSKGTEYFDKAALIYELEGCMGEAPNVQYEKGILLTKGLPKTKENAEDAFQRVLELYQNNKYEDTDSFSMSCYYLAYLQEDTELRLEYLKKGEAQLSSLSPGGEQEICETLYSGLAMAYSSDRDFNSSLKYHEKILHMLEGTSDAAKKVLLANTYRMSGACLIYVKDTAEALKRIENAIIIYEEMGSSSYYTEMASSYVYLALAYASQNVPNAEKMLECAETAFTYYKNRDAITNFDLDNIEVLKTIIRKAYETAYPEKEEWEFDDWYNSNTKWNASTYQYYTNW